MTSNSSGAEQAQNPTAKQPKLDTEFMPAAESLIERPASPWSRLFMMTICVMFLAAALWAWLARVDTVVVAQGRLVSEDRSKFVQSEFGGVVRNIFVRNGQLVQKGDVLIELDPTLSEAEFDGTASRLQVLALEQALLNALLADLETPILIVPTDVDPSEFNEITRRLNDEMSERRETLANFEAQKAQSLASIETSRLRASRIEGLLPGLEDRLARANRLRVDQLISILEYQQIERELESEVTNWELVNAQVFELQAQVASVEQQRITYLAQKRAEHAEQLQTVRAQIAEAEQTHKAQARSLELRQLLSPETGTVQELTAYTVGGVITSGEVVMKIAPESFELEGEALLLNRDRGFVREGMDTKIKLEAFPFTKYGFLDGRIASISTDAVEDQRLGPVFGSMIEFDARTISVESEEVRLTPGMMAQFEVQTGQKRVLEFLISPLLRYRDEALRER